MPDFFRAARPLTFAALLCALGAAPVSAESAGAYLAARAAADAQDYRAAARYYDRLLAGTPGDITLQESALLAHVILGEYDAAIKLAAGMDPSAEGSQIAALVQLAEAAQRSDFAAGLALLAQEGDAPAVADPGALFSGLYKAWALAGEGQMSEATRAFDDLAQTKGLGGFAAYHKALALAMVGDYEGADQILSGPAKETVRAARRAVLAHVQILSQLERDGDALALLDEVFSDALDPQLSAIRAQLEAGEVLPFTLVSSARDGIAEVYFTIASVLASDAPGPYPLVQARLAHYLRPDHDDAALLIASLFEADERYDLAIESYALVAPDSPIFHAAELGRAEAMVRDGRTEAAIEVLEQLSRTHPKIAGVWNALGDTLRREDRFADAVKAYDQAIALAGDPKPADWFVWYARGIAEERSDQWTKAEADFRKALELSPDQPAVLNYLGYSYVEKGENLDEALDMIQRAVVGRPDSGYIVDSLGWALYRLGRYDEAVVQMERAVELEAVDPLVTDHLGDVYWAVGRKREAEFQWRRALSFGPGDDLDMDRVRRKLEVGLDKVLAEEGAPPLQARPAPAPAAAPAEGGADGGN